MKKGFIPSVIFVSCLAVTGFLGCKKESTLGIDNDSVVKTPYSLYAANSDGALINSTDGTNFMMIFPPDGYKTRLILTSGSNLMILKENLHLSENEGHDFNPVYNRVNPFPWQTMAYNSVYQNRVYIASKDGNGIAYSADSGKTWQLDDAWDDNLPPEFEISSFSGLADKSMYAYSNLNNVLFKKDNVDDSWTPITAEGLFPAAGTKFFLTSNESTLFLTDYSGKGGVWYSDDEGINWTRFGQGDLPLNTHWNCAISPNGGHSFVVGTDSAGIYMVQNGTLVSATGGLELQTSAYSICEKSNTYKNNVIKNYLFVGTSTGIYRSEDLGRTWDKMTFGVWNQKYVATY
jgi:hypothetical protein